MTTTFRQTSATDIHDALTYLQAEIGRGNAEKGFHEEGDRLRAELAAHIEAVGDRAAGRGPRQFRESALRNYYAARLALITTEVAEAIEELRSGRAVNETYYPTATDEDNARNVRDGLTPAELNLKPEGVPSELADIAIRAFDFADEAGIDLAAIIDEKLAYNETRPAMHGREF